MCLWLHLISLPLFHEFSFVTSFHSWTPLWSMFVAVIVFVDYSWTLICDILSFMWLCSWVRLSSLVSSFHELLSIMILVQSWGCGSGLVQELHSCALVNHKLNSFTRSHARVSFQEYYSFMWLCSRPRLSSFVRTFHEIQSIENSTCCLAPFVPLIVFMVTFGLGHEFLSCTLSR